MDHAPGLKPGPFGGAGSSPAQGTHRSVTPRRRRWGAATVGAKRAIKKHDRDHKVRAYLVKTRAAMDPELAELLRNPEFVESLEQMQRGEGRVIHPRD